MVAIPEDELSRISTSAAEHFTDEYYSALHSSRGKIASFYVPHSTITPGRDLPVITYNGQTISDPVAFQKTFENDMPFAYFEVQSLDVQVLNPTIDPTVEAAGRGRSKQVEQNMSLLVQVSGYVRLVERKEGPMRGFSDTFALVPNRDTGGKGRGRSWLIQTQNFRFVV